jgi:hypothetical protein
MRFTRRAALAGALAGAIAGAIPLAAAAEERVYVLRTQEDGSVVPDCPTDDTVKLGALVFAPRTRTRDGLMTEDGTWSIGTAVGCGRLLTYTPFDTQVRNPFALKLELEDGIITARGDCTITSVNFPVPDLPAPLLLLGCALAVDEDPSAGILNGSATSSSVFMPTAVPGYRTGSLWTVRLYVDESFGRSRGRPHPLPR